MQEFWHKAPTAKRLLLSLLSAPELREMSAQQAIRWGNLFDIDAAAIRVTLGRMLRLDLLESPRRGSYAIGPAGSTLAETARRWTSAEARIKNWDGAWLLVHTAHLGRTDKPALRARERALTLDGFALVERGLWCRPANYREATSATLARMRALGLEEGALLLEGTTTPADRLSAKLWPREALEAGYRRFAEAMAASRQRMPDLDDNAAAKETFLLGEAVIRQINSDPLLPDELIDANARRTMHSSMVSYDQLGREVWERFMQD